MDLSKLFEMQKALDDRIIKEHGLEGQDLLHYKVLALEVELGECANEWKGFKFWKSQIATNTKKLLEEYVDCIHFLLSIGIELNLTNVKILDLFSVSTISLFRILFKTITDVSVHRDSKSYTLLFSEFVSLGQCLGFTWEQIEAAYMEKNKVNHQRQDNHY